MSKTYRAAILFSADRQGSTALTAPEHAGLSDADLLAEAQREIERADIRRCPHDDEHGDLCGGTVEIGEWTEA